MRLFLALPLPEQVKHALVSVQGQMYDLGVRGYFTRAENLHLTLAFIGEYPEPEPVLCAVSGIHFCPMTLTLDRLGAFDSVWWAGLADSPELDKLVRRVRRSLGDAGIPFDRKRFSAHITLVRKPVCTKGQSPGRIELKPVSMTADRFYLLRSDRGKHGMRYTRLGTIYADTAL